MLSTACSRLAVAATILLNSGPSSYGSDPIPGTFAGVWQWAEAAQECSASDFEERDTDTLIQIDGTSIEYWEAECVARSVRGGLDPNIARLALSCSGEGEEWEADQVWFRQELLGKEALVIVDLQDLFGATYTKCRASE